ncbi:MAG: tetratricopeptide repeat protein [Myxococcales bacterium]|nr:tetratricopeptide repeat protein [Myxococcales bacterium]
MEGRVVLGSALMALARFDEVLGEMKSALDMQPGNPSALALQGEALLRKGDGSRAVAVLEQAARVAPGDPYVERLRVEAAAVAVAGPSPLLAVNIDPELEGVAIREEDVAPLEVSAADLIEVDPELEELDADLLIEATPIPMPASAKLPGPGIHGDNGPFVDLRGTRGGDEALNSIPMTDAPTPDPSTPDPARARAHTREASQPRPSSRTFDFDDEIPTPARPATVDTLFPNDEEPGPQRPATIGTLFPDDTSAVEQGYDYLESAPTAVRNEDMDVIRHGFGGRRRGRLLDVRSLLHERYRLLPRSPPNHRIPKDAVRHPLGAARSAFGQAGD